MRYGERTPESEWLDEGVAAEIASSASESGLSSSLDARCAERALALGGCEGTVLDVGCGAGGASLQLLRRAPSLRVVAIDASHAVIAIARATARDAGLGDRIDFCRADAKRLPFRGGSFDLVLSDSLLRRLSAPLPMLNESARVLRSGGALYIRDLRRPPAELLPLHAAWHGRAYRGAIRQRFGAAVRSAYSEREISELVNRSTIRGAVIRREHGGFIAIERPAR